MMRHKTPAVIVNGSRFLSFLTDFFHKAEIRLRTLSQVAALGMPVIHLGIDIDRPVAAPGSAQLPAPDSLQVGGKASFSGGSDEQIPSVLEKQAVKAIVLFSLF